MRCAIRYTIVRVLPVPAPASTQTGPLGARTAASCSGSKPDSSSRSPMPRILTEPAGERSDPGLLLAVIIFGRRVQRNVFGKAEGQPGAAAWALDNMRGRWTVTPTVAGTAQLDAVHRVIGRPGVVLVAEGAPHRVKSLLAQEKKRVARVVGDTPIYDLIVGNEEDQVPLRRLQQRIMKLPNNLKPAQIDTLEKRLSALASRGAALPKGPMPQGTKMR